MSDRIRWVNHASYVLESGAVRLMTDPWLEGNAFNDGWSLLTPSVFSYEQFAGITHLWISHEHPDHFCPWVLRKIPEADRQRIEVIYQATKDGRVAAYCRRLGFRVVELARGDWHELGDGVRICVGTVGHDSWHVVKTPETTLVNTNDCILGDDRHMQRVVDAAGDSVDVLLTQFSYAQWVGNPGEIGRMRAAAAAKLGQMDSQVAALRPKALVPFASYTWFSHAENWHLNEGANRVSDVLGRYADNALDCVVLAPGDSWTIGAPHDSGPALEAYAVAVAEWQTRGATPPPEPTPLAELHDQAGKLVAALASKNALAAVKPLEWVGYLRPVRIFVTDLGVALEFSMFKGLAEIDVSREHCDVAFGSQSLAFCMKHGFGVETLLINGRYAELQPGGTDSLSRQFAIHRHNEHGARFPWTFIQPEYVRAKVRNALGVGA